MKEVAIVRNADNEEMYFAESVGQCKEWCKLNNITGNNGEYIAIGTYNEETRYFDLEDYMEIA